MTPLQQCASNFHSIDGIATIGSTSSKSSVFHMLCFPYSICQSSLYIRRFTIELKTKFNKRSISSKHINFVNNNWIDALIWSIVTKQTNQEHWKYTKNIRSSRTCSSSLWNPWIIDFCFHPFIFRDNFHVIPISVTNTIMTFILVSIILGYNRFLHNRTNCHF